MFPDQPGIEELTRSEHLGGLTGTGDNIEVKKVAGYASDENNLWQRIPLPYIDRGYDYVGFSNPDGNGNYQTIVFNVGGSGGTTQRTLTLSYDSSNNVTSIARA